MSLRSVLAAAAFATLLFAGLSQASPVGTQYYIQGVNFPNDYGPSAVTFDGVEEAIAGSTNMLVNEQYAPFPGGGPAPFDQPGEGIQFSFRTSDGSAMASTLTAQSDVFITQLNFNTPGKYPVVRQNTAFVYFTANGVPQPMRDVLGLGVVFGPHPFNPAISQVALLGNDEIVGTVDGVSLPDPLTKLAWGNLMLALGITPATKVNDAHVGFIVDLVPEPATCALTAIGLLAATRRRRS